MYNLVSDLKQISEVLSNTSIIGLDLETTGLNPLTDKLRLIQIADEYDNINIIDCFKFNVVDIHNALLPYLENPRLKIVIQNSIFERKWFKHVLGIELGTVFDTMLASKLLGFNDKAGLGFIIKNYLNIDISKAEQKSDWGGVLSQSQLEYAAIDVKYLIKLRAVMLQKLQDLDMLQAAQLEFETVPSVASMELAGFPVNRNKFYDFIAITEVERDKAFNALNHFLMSGGYNHDYERTYAFDLFGNQIETANESSLNIRSTQQLIEKFKAAGINIGTTDKKFIAIEAQRNPDLKLLLNFREKEKLCSTYGRDFLHKYVQGDDRVYGSFIQLGAVTGRFAARNPNTMNYPRSKAFRALFEAPKGKKFVQIDYSQMELRALADYSRDVIMLDAFATGKDLHSVTTSMLFNIPYDECKNPENAGKRVFAKTCFSGDTEILTKNGWLRFDQYDGKTEVLQFELPEGIQYNPPLPRSNRWGLPTGKQVWDGSGKASFVKPLDFQKFENQKLYHHVDRNTDFLMTGNHNVIFVDGNNRARKVEALNVVKGNIQYIPASGYFNYENLLLTEAETRFLAMLTSDGSIDEYGHVKFGFTKTRKIERCREILTQCDLEYTFSANISNGKHKPVASFYVSHTKNTDFLDRLFAFVDRKKTLSEHCIAHIDGKVYLDEAAFWDGSFIKSKKPSCRKRVKFSSFNLKTLDIMQIMACLNGIQSVVNAKAHSLSYRLSSLDRFEGKHAVSWNLTDTHTTSDVYCVQVPAGAIMIRRNGKIAVSGNCNFAIAYGIGAQGLALRIQEKGIDTDENKCQEIIDGWYSSYAEAGKWLKKQRYLVSNAIKKNNWKMGENGYVDLIAKDGRLIRTNFIVGDFSAEAGSKRDCMNFLLQNINALATKKAMTLMYKDLSIYYPTARIVNVIHDEVLVECDEQDAEGVKDIVEKSMIAGGQAFLDVVNVVADAKICQNWAEK